MSILSYNGVPACDGMEGNVFALAIDPIAAFVVAQALKGQVLQDRSGKRLLASMLHAAGGAHSALVVVEDGHRFGARHRTIGAHALAQWRVKDHRLFASLAVEKSFAHDLYRGGGGGG